MDNIVLIGMPGVGKSSAGVVLAKVLGYEFVDTDLVIQRVEKRLLKDIIAMDGNDAFLEIENRINAGIDVHNSVIATGGSVIYGKEAMEHLKKIGTVVYLRASLETIKSRLLNLEGRGVAMKSGQSLEDLYNERIPLYEQYSDVIIDLDGTTIEETVRNMQKILRKS